MSGFLKDFKVRRDLKSGDTLGDITTNRGFGLQHNHDTRASDKHLQLVMTQQDKVTIWFL